jgi:phosphoserine phosphatase
MRLAYALVLTAPVGSAALSHEVIDRARGLLPKDVILDERWLEEGEAWEALFTAADEPDEALALRHEAVAAFKAFPIDVNIVAADLAWRRKALLIADMESTIIGEELIDELAGYVGLREKISTITARAMRGELDFEAALKERVAMLAGLSADILDEVYEKRVTLMPGAAALVGTMRSEAGYAALVSGGFSVFTERVAKRVGFDEQQANTLGIENGKLTGRVSEPILGRAAKRAALLRIAARLNIAIPKTLAVGDGANDLDMLAAAGLGVAFRAKPKVQEAARELPNGAVITHGDLTSLLYLQGYRRAEFLTSAG